MRTLIDASLERSRTVLMTLLLIFSVGTMSYIAIPKEDNPDIAIPIIYVSLHHEGIAPEDAESLLVRPMEQELQSIEGIKEMKATAYEGGANVLLEFTAGFDSDKALDDVREAVDKAKPELPTETDEPTVSEVNFSLFPVLVVTLSGEVSQRKLLKIADDLQERIESLQTVLEANIAGDREEQLEIVINPQAIASYGLNGADVIDFFSRSNKLVAAGNLDTGMGRFSIKVPGRLETAKDIMDMPLVINGDAVVRVRDIAELRRNFKDPESFARLDGEQAVALEIVKRTGENVIDTIIQVREIVAQEQRFWPAGVEVSFSQDKSEDIRDMLRDLQNNIISAVLLVMIVCVAALGLTSATLVGIAIPGAFLTGIMFLYFIGFTVNMVVLFALILSVGMLVDGAIVVTEYADRKLSEGLPKKEAYGLAAKRMAWPIIASTATTLAAFFPLLFWPDIVGEFMKYMPITLIAVLSASLMMALIFVPVLGGIIGRPSENAKDENAKHLSGDTGDLDKVTGITGVYVRILRAALRVPALVLLSALGILVAVNIAYGKFGKGVEFFPDVEPKAATVLVHARGNLSIYEQNAIMQEVEEIILTVDGFDNVYSRTGSAGSNDLAEDVIGQVQLGFKNWQERKTANEILAEIDEKTKHIAGVHVETQKQQEGPETGKAMELQLRSREPALLAKHVDIVRRGLDVVGDFKDIEDSRPMPGIEWELQIDRAQAAKFGLDTSSIGQSIRLITNGMVITDYLPNDADEDIDVIVRFPTDQRSLDQLDQLRIETNAGSIPISNFVKRVPKERTGRLERSDANRIMTVKADLPPGINKTAKLREMEAWLIKQKEWDPRVKFVFKGSDEDQQNAQAFLVKAFGIALFIMAIILVTQFNSFYHALLILSAVIMSTIGVMLGLLIMGKPFGIVMSGIGVISLAGIIVNNNIVLIDTFSNFRKKGMDVTEAAIRTGAQRLRPVMLTTITTCLGLMPMVLQMNIDFLARDISFGAPSTQWWVDLAMAIAFGLVFSTPLTLLVTPCALKLPEDVRRWFAVLKNKFGPKKEEPEMTNMDTPS